MEKPSLPAMVGLERGAAPVIACMLLLAAPLGMVSATVWQETNMPGPRWSTAEFWDPRPLPNIGCPQGCAYILGGSNVADYWDPPWYPSVTDRIYGYDPVSQTYMPKASLPKAMFGFEAAWAGNRAYIFGGWARLDSTTVQALDTILVFDPVSNTVHDSEVQLPDDGGVGFAFWVPPPGSSPGECTGGCAYVGAVASQTLWQFDPAAGTVRHAVDLVARPAPGSAAWDEQARKAYFLASHTSNGIPLPIVQEFLPDQKQVNVVPVTPYGLGWGAASFDGRCAYYFQGSIIVGYDPRTQQRLGMPENLPVEVGYASAISAGKKAFIVGGIDSSEGWEDWPDMAILSTVQRYENAITSGPSVTLALRTTPGVNRVVWDSGIIHCAQDPDAYRVYRNGRLIAEVAGTTKMLDDEVGWQLFTTAVTNRWCYRVTAVFAGEETAPGPTSCVVPW